MHFAVVAELNALRDFAELSSDWFWEQDSEFRFTRFSGVSTEKLRRRQAGFIGKRRWDMPISGITADQLAEHIATCERHEPFRDFEYEIPGDEGGVQYYSISGTPVFSDQGHFIGYRGVGRNITELRLSKQAIEASERQLAQIVDGSSIPTFVIDARHRITHWNQACASLTRLEVAKMVGSTEVWRAFYDTPRPVLANLVASGATDAAIAAHYDKFNRSPLIEGAVEAERFFPQMGEGGRWLFFTAVPLRDSTGNVSGVLETLQDVTERRRAEQALSQQSVALQNSNAEMEERVIARTAELTGQLHFLQQLIEAIPGPVFYKDANARYLGCNSAFESFIGRRASDIIGKSAHDIAPKALADRYLASDQELLDQPGSQIYESQVRYADGKARDVMFHKATFTRPDGSVGGLVGLMIDITERKRMEDHLRQAATVFDNSAEGISVTDPNGTFVAVNRAFTEITGYEMDEVIGKSSRIVQSGRHDKDFYRSMWESLLKQGRWQGEIYNRRKNGELYPEWISIAAVKDDKDRVTNYVATFSDITQRKQTEEKIQQLAFSDALTELPNRRLLLDRLQHAVSVSSRKMRSGALFFIDLDDFKDLNDTLGHATGDLLLQQVAKRLVGVVREGDTVARLGGDEFVVMLEDLSASNEEVGTEVELVGKKILTALNEPYILGEHVHHSTPSIGVTLFDGNLCSVDVLLRQADLAMYQAKKSGRNALCFFDPGMQTLVTARVKLETDLRVGIGDNQFVLYFQPQIGHGCTLVGAEALVRWNHPVRGMVSPAEFIPVAEASGLILPLGSWVLSAACKHLALWAKSPYSADLTLAVNVSARQFHQAGFVEEVLAVLNEYDVVPTRLKLELTESMLLEDMDEMIHRMAVLKEHGVCFSLDDFGTGYSSLSVLKRLPLDQLKIDQSFVRGILADANDAAIARTIVALAHTLGLSVIAEGVEDEAQLSFLAENGCHSYQGYLFGRPMPIEAFDLFSAKKSGE